MTRVLELVADRKTYSVDADSTVFEAARLMSEHQIGAVPVVRDGELCWHFFRT